MLFFWVSAPVKSLLDPTVSENYTVSIFRHEDGIKSHKNNIVVLFQDVISIYLISLKLNSQADRKL
jgi:hypothetical protein